MFTVLVLQRLNGVVLSIIMEGYMKKLLVMVLALIVALMCFGCQSPEETAELQAEPESTKVAVEEPAAEVEGQGTESVYEGEGWASSYYKPEEMKGISLNLYGVTDKVRPVLDAFEADTGIRIEHLTMKNGEILQRLSNEKDSGVVIADLWFTGGADTFINASQSDLLLKYQSPYGEVLADNMKDKGGYWYGTSLTLVNLVVNKELINEKGLNMIESWDDLLQEGLKGEVSMSNPASSGTAYNTVSAILETKGQEEGWAYLDQLIDQIPYFTARGSDPKKNVIAGEAIVGINASNGDRDVEINNPHVKLVYPKEGTGWWPQPVAIVNGTKNEDAAKVFIDWVISKRGMSVIAESRNAAVARTDIERPEGIIDISTVELFATDFQKNAENRDGILEEWKKHVE